MDADLILRKALVMDGTGRPGFPADVAVTGERIQAMGDLADWRAARELRADGLALAPGFVDMHGHSDYYLLALPSAESKIKQGITTEVGGNCGYSAAPVRGELAEDRKSSHRELFGLEVDWRDMDQYLERLAAARPAINFAPLVGFNTVRASVMGHSAEPADPAALAQMRGLIRDSLAAGAFGMSMGLIYAPGCFAKTPELIACAEEAAAVGGLVASHIRSEGDRLLDAIMEAVEIARQANVRFQVSHLKTSGSANWGKLARVFEIIEAAKKEGLALAADRYPYLASFTQLSSALPDWVFEGGKEAFFGRLRDPAARERMRGELNASDERRERWERIVVAQVFDPALAGFEGRSVAEAAAEKGQDPLDFVCWLAGETKDRASAIYHTMSTGNLERIYKKDWVMVGSDAAARTHAGPLAEGKPHPRAFGTMPRMIAWVVREKGWLTLPAAVKKMTRDPAAAAGLKDRGLVREGQFADLVLFDPLAVRDLATYENPHQYPEGIRMVVVNGKIAVENGQLTGERAGQVLRRSP